MKICKRCNIEKELIEYAKNSSKTGLRHICRKCSYKKRTEIVRVFPNLLNYTCKCCNINKSISEFNKNSRKPIGIVPECKDCRSIKSRKRYLKKADEIKIKTNRYYHENKDKLSAKRLEYQKYKEDTDIFFKLTRRLRNRLYYALKKTSWKKNTKFSEYIGCTLEELKYHLESQFKGDMTWDNYGNWHIDHKIPLSSAQTEEQLYKLCNYTNLQPLWALDNIKKNDKLEYEVKQISPKDTHPYLLNIHYSKRIPSISYAYGLFANNELVGIVTYGPTASPGTAVALIGLDHKSSVYELNRLCLKNNLKNEASILVGRSLKLLPKGLVILSFADSNQNHTGYIYQATNFKYYGKTKAKSEVALKSKPAAHSLSIYDESKGQEDRIGFLKQKYGDDLYWRKRSEKHRYVYVTGKDKSLFELIKHTEQPYPKK